MSHEDIKKVSEAYLSIYKSVEDPVNEETEEQLDEARRVNPKMALKRSVKVRSEIWDVGDMLQDIADDIDNPIDQRLSNEYVKTTKKLVGILIDMENKVRKIT